MKESEIEHKTFLAYRTVRKHIKELVEIGMLSYDHDKLTYHVTPKGQKFVKWRQNTSDFFGEDDDE